MSRTIFSPVDKKLLQQTRFSPVKRVSRAKRVHAAKYDTKNVYLSKNKYGGKKIQQKKDNLFKILTLYFQTLGIMHYSVELRPTGYLTTKCSYTL